MFKNIFKNILREKKIATIHVVHEFPLYGLLPEAYTLTFIEGRFGRFVDIKGSEFCLKWKLWMGTEIWVLSAQPWIHKKLSNAELIAHLDLIKMIGSGKKIRKPKIDNNNNIIRLSDYLPRKPEKDL